MKGKKMKKLLVGSCLAFVLFGTFVNSSFFNEKKNEAYGQIKEQYGLSSDIDTNDETEQNNENTEEVVAEQPVEETQRKREEVQVTSRSSNEKRTNENIVWDYLLDAGYSKVQAAGIIGNMWQESGVNPSRNESNGIGFGLVQWSFGRRQQLESYASSRGKSASDIYVQLEFLVKELRAGKQFYGTYAEQFANPYSVDQATEAFCWGFERPHKDHANMANRKKQAWAAYYRNVDR